MDKRANGSSGLYAKSSITLTEVENRSLSARPLKTLESKVAIVTGAGAHGYSIGIGRAAAIMLAEAGANVICVDKDAAAAERTVAMTRHLNLSGTAIAVVADVTNEAQCEEIVRLAMDKFGRLDVLVNNVGIHGSKGNSISVDVGQFDVAMHINVTSMILMAKYAIPAMISKKSGAGEDIKVCGSVVNIASVNGIRGGSPDIIYPTTKGAIVNMTRAMAAHHGPSGIRVNCICPGAVYTPMVGGVEGGMSEAIRLSRMKRSILGTEGTGWDIGAAIKFLASDEAAWITGVVLPVDAGATAAIGIGHNMGH
ncbi:short chain dehydrogenase reductase like [Trichoderma arundinaceum]|uniref:Short chain dehydrogenase reductase like n=1 Tax=Trichoderma arundinaceum TaxID=490622 RepID=A0A395N9R7_TRIAR|nr:short chain dehydrogenase reductase like [Trichoderma arundinaceum]